MQTNSRRSRTRSSSPDVSDGVLVLSGYGIAVTVERGHLVYSDGFGRHRRTGRLARATARLRRLVVLGRTGHVTLDALRWLHGVGASFVHIDTDGTVFQVSAPLGLDDARLRRAQALAPTNGVGLAVARDLLREKLSEQRRLLARLSAADDAAATLEASMEGLPAAQSPAELMLLEAAGAQAYWGAWASLPVRFVQRDADRVPEHWRTFGGRMSPLTGNTRRAANPANAMLNYCYALLETECRIAALAVGLDAGMGVLHADQPARDSLALDLMEPLRPDVDSYILDLLDSRLFAAREFLETTSGDCRLVSPLPQLQAAILPHIQRAVGPVAERVARQLVARQTVRPSSTVEGFPLPTPLTQAHRSAGRATVRVKPKPKGETSPHIPQPPRNCMVCGTVVPSAREICDACEPDWRESQRKRFAGSGLPALERMRREGRDPRSTPSTREKLRESALRRLLADKQWEREYPEPRISQEFVDSIQPRLSTLSLTQMVHATGLSATQCARIRNGEAIPHVRHWAALSRAALESERRSS